MAIPIAVGLIATNLFPSALADIAVTLAPAVSMTVGICMLPEDFRNRRGSLSTAVGLVTAMWAVALIVALLRWLR